VSGAAGSGAASGAGRRLLLGRQLLDRQIVDRHGRLAGKVDDVEITLPDRDRDGAGSADSADAAGRPVVTALLSGRQALAHRLGGRLGRLADALSRRLLPDPHDEGAPAGDGRIWFGDVTDVGNHVTIAAEAGDLATEAVEDAVRTSIIGRIPGAGDAG
jgi:hypothetical protein